MQMHEQTQKQIQIAKTKFPMYVYVCVQDTDKCIYIYSI